MRILAMLVCFGMAACAQQPSGPSLSDIEDECRVGGKPFTETWSCVRVGMSSVPSYSDVRALYIATGDYIATQVKEGKMTDAEAKLAMAEAKQRAYETSVARERQDDAARTQRAIVASSTMNRPSPFTTPAIAQPAYTQPTFIQPTMVTVGNRTMMCQQFNPSQITCF